MQQVEKVKSLQKQVKNNEPRLLCETSYAKRHTSSSFAIMSTSAALILTAANSFSLEKNNHELASIQVEHNATYMNSYIYTNAKKGQRKNTLLLLKDKNRLLLTYVPWLELSLETKNNHFWHNSRSFSVHHIVVSDIPNVSCIWEEIL